jgi:hypothetical protein
MRKTTFRAVRATLGTLTVLATLFGPFGADLSTTRIGHAEDVARTKTVTGTVTYKGTTTPVVGAQLNFWPKMQTPYGGGSATTDAAGNYTVNLPPASLYGMNSWASSNVDWAFTEQTPDIAFSNDATAETKTLIFQLTKATAIITGTVTKSDGTLVTEGNMNAWPSSGNGGGNINAGVQSGSYTMHVPSGSYGIGFWSPDPTLTAAQQVVTIGENETKTVNFIVKAKTAHITGRTIDASGNPIAGIRMNAFCMDPGASGNQNGPQPGVNSNATTGADGSFDLALLAGKCNVNIDTWKDPNVPDTGASYVYNGTPLDTTLDTDTSTVGLGNIVVTLADATIRVTVVDEAGAPVTGLNGYVSAQKAEQEQFGPGQNFGAPLMQNGVATIHMPSSVFSLVKLNMYMPPESQYSVAEMPTVSVTANSTVDATLRLVKNNSSIYGSLVDQNGIPLSTCTPPAGQFSFGDVFVMSQSKGSRNAQFKSDCSYSMSVVAGEYSFNYHFNDGSGLLNPNQTQDKVNVKAGENVVKNITVLVGDAKIDVTVLDPNGNPIQAYVDAGNEPEIFGKPGGSGPQGEGPKDLNAAEFKDKNGKGGDIFEVCMRAYQKKDTKQIKQCEAKKLPDISSGPGGCKNVGACVKYCMVKSHQEECGKFKGPENKVDQSKPQTGPGGCKSETECNAFCSKPENQQECMKFSPPSEGGNLTGASFFKGQVKGESTEQGDRAMGGPRPEDFKKILHNGTMTDKNGKGSITLLSGHLYEVRANPAPGTPWMAPLSQYVDFTAGGKISNIVLVMRQADAKITGTCTGGGSNGFVHGWMENGGGGSGSPVQSGKYEINVSKGVWHVGCDAPNGYDFFRSDEMTIVVDGSQKVITQNFVVSKNSNFRIPPPISKTFSASEAATIVLEDGTTMVANANAFSTAAADQITVTATPTANLMSLANAKPAWYGVQFQAVNATTGAEITKFNANVTISFKYTDQMLEAAGIEESGLVPKYWDDTTNTWKSPDNVTADFDNNTLTITSDHFSKWSPTTNGQAKSLKSVSKLTGKNKGKVKIDKKTVTAFAGTNVNAATANLGGTLGQLVFVSPAEKLKKGDAVVKVYNTKGKLVKTLNPYKGSKEAIGLTLSDVTKDGKSDLIVNQSGNGTVKVINTAKKYAVYTLNLGAKRNSTVNITTLQAHQAGVASVAALVKTGKTNDVKVYKFSKNKFTEDKALNETSNRIKISGSSLSLITLKPNGKASTSLSRTKTSTKVNLVGANFEKGMVATIGSIAGTVKVTNGKAASVTFNGTLLTKGKKTLKLVNPSGGTGSMSVTVK